MGEVAGLRRVERDLIPQRSGFETDTEIQTEAEETFSKIHRDCAQQGTRSFEFKAVISLSRLQEQQRTN
jgi:hypothetical protein